MVIDRDRFPQAQPHLRGRGRAGPPARRAHGGRRPVRATWSCSRGRPASPTGRGRSRTAGTLSRRLESDLLAAGEAVVRVPPKLMAGARRSSREPGKSDPIDALAVARAALREPDLPVARLDGPEREVRLLVDHREDLVVQRTGHENRLRWHLHELAPGGEPAPRTLGRLPVLDALAARLAGIDGPVARIARDLVARIRELTTAVTALERRAGRPGPADRAGPPGPPGLWRPHGGQARRRGGAASGASGPPRRSPAGTAPRPSRSGPGDSTRVRLSRGGNRQVNAALHRIAVTQLRLPGPGRDYVARRRAAGDTWTEALRALRRRLSDEVYRRMRTDEQARMSLPVGLRAAA